MTWCRDARSPGRKSTQLLGTGTHSAHHPSLRVDPSDLSLRRISARISGTPLARRTGPPSLERKRGIGAAGAKHFKVRRVNPAARGILRMLWRWFLRHSTKPARKQRRQRIDGQVA
jgi:hypothetical protein